MNPPVKVGDRIRIVNASSEVDPYKIGSIVIEGVTLDLVAVDPSAPSYPDLVAQRDGARASLAETDAKLTEVLAERDAARQERNDSERDRKGIAYVLRLAEERAAAGDLQIVRLRNELVEAREEAITLRDQVAVLTARANG